VVMICSAGACREDLKDTHLPKQERIPLHHYRFSTVLGWVVLGYSAVSREKSVSIVSCDIASWARSDRRGMWTSLGASPRLSSIYCLNCA
jgi:hypothetical protein